MKSISILFYGFKTFGIDIYDKFNYKFLSVVLISILHSLLDSLGLVLFIIFSNFVITGEIKNLDNFNNLPIKSNILFELDIRIIIISLITIYILAGILYSYRGYISSAMASEYINIWRLKLVRSVLESKLQFFNSENTKAAHSSLNHDINSIAAGFFEFQVVTNTIIITLVYMIISLLISVNATILILSIGIGILFLSKKSIIIGYANNKQYAKYLSIFLSESTNLVSNIKFIKATSSEKYFYERLKSIADSIKKFYIKIILRPIIQKSIIETIGVILLVIVLYVMLFLIKIPYLELGAILLIFLRLFPRLLSLSHSTLSLSASSAVLDKNIALLGDMKKYRELDLNQGFSKNLNFKNISIVDLNSYESFDRKLLSGINLELRFGECVGIFGKSGSGKTTIINSILGLVDSTPSISIDGGITLNHSEIIKLRSFIGYVSQEDVFMNASIKDNIVWGSDFDIKHLNYIINLVGINKIISNLSNGLDTEISATGFVLSGGERQKLALARALYRRPKILILDEATSALDEQSEIEIMNIVYELKNIQSSIIISHNYKTLWGCEKIYIVEDGKILKSGPWAKI